MKKIYAAAAVDIEYAKGAEWGPNNPMDLNGAAGLAQLLHAVVCLTISFSVSVQVHHT